MNKQILVTGNRGWIDEQQEAWARTVVWKAWYRGDRLLIPDLTGIGATVLEHANRIQAQYCVVGTKPRPKLYGVRRECYVNAARLIPTGSSQAEVSRAIACWMVQQAQAVTLIVHRMPAHGLAIMEAAQLRGIPLQILSIYSTDYTQEFSGETR